MTAEEALQVLRDYFDTQRGDVLGAMAALEKAVKELAEFKRAWAATDVDDLDEAAMGMLRERRRLSGG